jgi:hypothetical protein
VRLPERADQIAWGVLGASAAATFAVWMFFFPDSIAEKFAWDVHPRMTQLFIGAGYVFRTAFFLSIAFGKDWTKLRWMFWATWRSPGRCCSPRSGTPASSTGIRRRRSSATSG